LRGSESVNICGSTEVFVDVSCSGAVPVVPEWYGEPQRADQEWVDVAYARIASGDIADGDGQTVGGAGRGNCVRSCARRRRDR